MDTARCARPLWFPPACDWVFPILQMRKQVQGVSHVPGGQSWARDLDPLPEELPRVGPEEGGRWGQPGARRRNPGGVTSHLCLQNPSPDMSTHAPTSC